MLRRAPNQLSDPQASAQAKADAYKLLLRIGWTQQLVQYVSAHKMSQMTHRDPANPSTEPYATQPRIGLHAASPSNGEAACDEESQWWAFFEREGLKRQASRDGWAEVLAELKERGGTFWKKF